ncbi:MAG: spermidine synthase [Gammaproteobacteria bacterium SG8_11]|nr:MAG: spermidine synthase [Gammaproteobacteria bacterium SG8_11]
MDASHSIRAPAISILLISASALAFEVLLMRIFSVIQWHHFAYMVISLALLGYGVSGTFLSIAQKWLLNRYPVAFVGNSLLFGLFILVSFLIAQSISFNPEELFWDWTSYFRLLLIYLCLSLPFFFAANCIALTFLRFGDKISKIYAIDLIGASIGSMLVIALLFTTLPNEAIRYLSLAGVLAGLIAWIEIGNTTHRLLISGVCAALIIAVIPSSWLALKISPYKSLPQVLTISGTRTLEQLSSPLGLISVVESEQVPFRFAPGLSLLATQTPPEQLAIFTDADAMTVITKNQGDRQSLSYLDYLTSALPYHLRRMNNVMILGAGAGSEVLQAKFHNVANIVAVELNPQIIELLTHRYADYSGNLYKSDNIEVRIDEARGLVLKDNNHYDLIQLAMLDSFSAAASGLYALNESYLYTVEALTEILRRLNPQGYLAVTRWVKLPPKDTIKLFATAVDALKLLSITDVEKHLVLIRGWQTSTLLIKITPFTLQEIAAIKQFNEKRAFDAAYYPGIKPDEVNKINIINQPYFYLAATALLSEDSEQFIKNYKFNIRPATDNKPYFFNFFKWETFNELLGLRKQGAMAMVEWGYMLLVITLLQVLVVSILLILSPLKLLKTTQHGIFPGYLKLKVFIYFSAIGLAFLFLEIVFLQKFMLFLHHPIYAATAILTGFLLFSGIGSALSARLLNKLQRKRIVIYAVTGISVVSLLYIAILPGIFNGFMQWSLLPKMIFSMLLIFPVALLMGMPFPVALSELNVTSQPLIPWAWAINGCASVVSAVLAALIAVQYGFTAVISLAVLLYIVAAIFFPNQKVTFAREKT